jgi:L,D-transpeptidase YcbB
MNKLYLLLIIFVFFNCSKKPERVSKNYEASMVDFSVFDTSIKIDSTQIIDLKNEDLKLFYRKFNYETVWLQVENRQAVIDEISYALEDGLDVEDYNFSKIKNFEKNYNSLSEQDLIAYDLLLTNSLHDYLSHLNNGKILPEKVYTDWDIKKNYKNVNNLVINSVETSNFKENIQNSKPTHAVYDQLKRSLRILRDLPDTTFESFDIYSRAVVSGKSPKVILKVKERLQFWGDMEPTEVITDKPDKQMVDALKQFQLRHGLKSDGAIGRGTLDAMNFTKEKRIEQVIANLERWRWFARDFGQHYILTNIPEYKLVAIKGKDTMQVQRIVVGKETRRTPVLESKISNINLNPNWTVPPTILAEDVFPDVLKSRSAFAKQRLKIFNWKKKEISASEWKMEEADKYQYIQMPGRNNALGLMKINFPNKYSVYMHDTNHRDFFKLNYRSLSSGCVRLEKPMEMAHYLLNDSIKWPMQKIKDTTDINYYFKLKREKEKELNKKNAELMAKNPMLVLTPKKLKDPELKTIVIPITEPIQIHQLYWTAWEKNGKLQFREDIYCLDQELYVKLRKQ